VVSHDHDNEVKGPDPASDEDEYNFGSQKGLEFDNLLLNDEEFFLGTNAEDYISMVYEIVDELSRYK
jgi:hypothetical protein